jgi:hypothetical protein
MRKLIEATLVSLDGVVGSPEEWALPRCGEENKQFARTANSLTWVRSRLGG